MPLLGYTADSQLLQNLSLIEEEWAWGGSVHLVLRDRPEDEDIDDEDEKRE